jgi:glycine cleavage system H protein
MDPEKLRYSKTHEWVHVDAGTATIGITDFAVEQLTDLVYVELPKVGARVSAGEPFGEIESVKAVSDLYSPVDGEVVAVNEALPDDLGRLSKDPYGSGWMIKVKIADESAATQLMDQAAYRKQIAEEEL